MGTWTKRILKWLGGTLLVLVVAAIAIPYFFKDQILAKVKDEANKQLNATVDFKDVGLSLLWTFPNFTFTLDQLTVTGKDAFEGLKLVDIEQFKISLDLWSVFSGDYVINGITLEKPNFFVKVLNNGKANYDIVKSDSTATADTTTTASEPTSFKLALSYYAIRNGNITYDDAPSDMFVEIKNLNHEGSGDFTEALYDIYTTTTMDAFTVAMGNIRYLNKTKVAIDFNANVDASKGMKIKLLDNSFKFNDLGLKAEGEIDMPNESDINVDMSFKADDTKFASVLSMIPAAYTQDFKDVKANGTFNFNGKVKGTYNEKSLPAFDLNLEVENADFQYPSLPMAVKDINTKIHINSPSADLDKMAIDILRFHLQLGANPFDLVLKLRTPMSDPDIDAKLNGKIDLADLQKAFPMEGTQLSGLITTDLEAKTKVSYVTAQQYDKVAMRGNLGINNMNYIAAGTPAIKINAMKLEFTPNNANLHQLDLKMGKSDIQASGTLDNILTYFSRDKIMKGNLIVRSNLLDVNELMGTSAATDTTHANAATNMTDTTVAHSTEPMFDKFDFAADVQMNKIIYDVYDITNLKAVGNFSPSVANLSNFEMMLGKIDMRCNGRLENVFPYLFDGGSLKGEFNLTSNYMNLNQFMRADGQATEPQPTDAAPPANPETAATEYEPILVPNNLDFRFTSTITTLIYDTYRLQNVKCNIIVQHQIVKVQNLSSNFLGGLVAFSGEYNTQNNAKPAFAFAYDIAKIDFQQTARTIGLVKYFLPIFKSMQGKFDSQFKIDGVLNKNMYPDFKTLNADGLMVTYDAALKGFAPAKELANKLNVKEVENLVLKNTKNFFTIKNGRFEIKPFATTYQEIDMLLSGSHGLDNSLAYNLKLRVPRKLLEKNPTVGNAANNGLKALQGEASKLGVNLDAGEFVNLGVDIGGNFAKPEYKVKLLGVEGKGGQSLTDQAQEGLKAEADRLKAEAEAKAKAEADKLKADAEAKAKAEADRLKTQADKVKADAEAKAKAEADRLKAEAEKAKADAAAKAKAEAERLKKEAEDKLKGKLKNPFQKD